MHQKRAPTHRVITRLYVGKNGNLRTTPALAGGTLLPDAQQAIRLAYTFPTRFALSGELAINLWIDTHSPPPNLAIWLKRNTVDPQRTTRTTQTRLPCITTLIAVHNEFPTAEHPSRSANIALFRLESMTQPLLMSAGDRIEVEVGLLDDAVKLGSEAGGRRHNAIHYGGIYPSYLDVSGSA